MKYRNLTLAKDIIDLKPDLNAICSATGDTPLTYLVREVWFGTDVCYYLIRRRYSINSCRRKCCWKLWYVRSTYKYGC